jgi:hypothetical protein
VVYRTLLYGIPRLLQAVEHAGPPAEIVAGFEVSEVAELDMDEGIAELDMDDGNPEPDTEEGIAELGTGEEIVELDMGEEIAELDMDEGIAESDKDRFSKLDTEVAVGETEVVIDLNSEVLDTEVGVEVEDVIEVGMPALSLELAVVIYKGDVELPTGSGFVVVGVVVASVVATGLLDGTVVPVPPTSGKKTHALASPDAAAPLYAGAN